MISGDFTFARTLEEFYESICECQENAHGSDYTLVHDEIMNKLSVTIFDKTTLTYRELGVNQGATAAVALLCRPQSVSLIDHNLSNFKPYQHLFESYAKYHNVSFSAEEQSSLNPKSVKEVDVLYIDTLHNGEHLTKELMLHAPSVAYNIICHDTHTHPFMFAAIQNFCRTNPWHIIKHETRSVGFTTIERTE